MALESKTIFFSLASFLIFIIILSVLGVLGPVPSSKEKEIVVKTNEDQSFQFETIKGKTYQLIRI